MSTSLRAASRRSAVPSIEPSETTTSSTCSGASSPAAARRITPTFSTISSPPLKTGHDDRQDGPPLAAVVVVRRVPAPCDLAPHDHRVDSRREALEPSLSERERATVSERRVPRLEPARQLPEAGSTPLPSTSRTARPCDSNSSRSPPIARRRCTCCHEACARTRPSTMHRKRIAEPGPLEVTLLSENGCQPRSSAAMLCQLVRFSVETDGDPVGRSRSRVDLGRRRRPCRRACSSTWFEATPRRSARRRRAASRSAPASATVDTA